MLWINNVLVKSPKVFGPDLNDLDSQDSYRDTKGELHRDRIAIDKRKLNAEWGPLTQEESSAILHAIEPEFFQMKYWDPKEGLIAKIFMAGPKSIPMLQMKDGVPMWEGLKVDFIEK